ncbi:hypothetical protein EYR41_007000 [Orbilia oligospora]|uniref:Uncharacterized protein n=1 Tax=Orbilia oligospora TaxID=2813651 RepID=A0A8H2HIG6_ORBOL|nr:hypothetical protein EYR41_007000 [Orbilia oligospora]
MRCNLSTLHSLSYYLDLLRQIYITRSGTDKIKAASRHQRRGGAAATDGGKLRQGTKSSYAANGMLDPKVDVLHTEIWYATYGWDFTMHRSHPFGRQLEARYQIRTAGIPSLSSIFYIFKYNLHCNSHETIARAALSRYSNLINSHILYYTYRIIQFRLSRRST